MRFATAGMGMLLALGLFIWDGQSRSPLPAYALTIGEQPIAVELVGSGPGDAIAFAGVCDGPISPYDSCLETISIGNVSEDAPARFRYDLYVWVDADGLDQGGVGPSADLLDECFVVGLAPGSAASLNPTESSAVRSGAGQLTKGQSDSWGIIARVTDDNACQNQTGTVLVTVVATSMPSVIDDPADGGNNGGGGDGSHGGGSSQPGGSPSSSGQTPAGSGSTQPLPPASRVVTGAELPRTLPATGSGGASNEVAGVSVRQLAVAMLVAGGLVLIATSRPTGAAK